MGVGRRGREDRCQEPSRPLAAGAEQVGDTQGNKNPALPPPHHDPIDCDSTNLGVGGGGLKATLEQVYGGSWPRDAGQWE